MPKFFFDPVILGNGYPPTATNRHLIGSDRTLSHNLCKLNASRIYGFCSRVRLDLVADDDV